jgi:hypothetical protein
MHGETVKKSSFCTYCEKCLNFIHAQWQPTIISATVISTLHMHKSKGKSVLVHWAIKVYGGAITTSAPDGGQCLSFTPRPISSWRNSYPVKRRLCGPHNWSRHFLLFSYNKGIMTVESVKYKETKFGSKFCQHINIQILVRNSGFGMNGVTSTDRTTHPANEWYDVSRQLYTKKYKTLSMAVNSKLTKFVYIITYYTRSA